jgi:hypothetical protein
VQENRSEGRATTGQRCGPFKGSGIDNGANSGRIRTDSLDTVYVVRMKDPRKECVVVHLPKRKPGDLPKHPIYVQHRAIRRQDHDGQVWASFPTAHLAIIMLFREG